MAGGGTGGHVIPALAVARELRRRGHEARFLGTERGLEARLVPAAGFPIHYIRIGGLKRLGWRRQVVTLFQLGQATAHMIGRLRVERPAAVFSMGGYVAGPAVLAALALRIPVVVMEPNAHPGITNRAIGRRVARALLSFPETARFFPRGKTELTGVPVREEFFALPPRRREGSFHVLITGGSHGSRTLNNAARESWPLFREAGIPVRWLIQSGREAFEELRAEFTASGMEGEVVAFIEDMSGAFAEADLIVCRAGAGAVAEVAAAGKPALLVPFPFAADDHQTRNAEAFARSGAAFLVPDREMSGRKLFEAIRELAAAPAELERMGHTARSMARQGAAARAAEALIHAAVSRL